MPKFPHVVVELVGQDGNAYMVLGLVSKAMRKAKVEKTEIDAFMAEATSGDYDHLLQTAMSYVTVE